MLVCAESSGITTFLGFLFRFSTSATCNYPNHGNSKIKTKILIKGNDLEIEAEIDIRVFAREKKCV